MSNSADWVTKTGSSGPIPATVWRRLTAVGYDWLLLTAMFFVITGGIVAVHRSGIPSGSAGLQIVLVATGWLYFAWCWIHGGQTVGMRAWKLRVVDAADAGRPVTWGRATVRFLAAWLPAAPLGATGAGLPLRLAAGLAILAYAAAFGVSALRRDGACWHDLLSGTRLIRAA